ncbi:uncharacterized protein MELLADRAFT_78983 [Melampsora larici-populina 98AG31]|uniref:Uncharacterized protein n=1 Tax=Melampsora larici-populina (strain 98AG31 / pathotype 3-4-7) TaxID=747676 RepID=F4S1C4_MELLP|nr:uncharacterized protein MELLADRAFT_78983 [Melampsora larici-populina 98AG31]EGG01585.1 hypothetical protein MELLADRAFT_78983 [Melampsora larici-populina 98AG31]
MNAEAIGSDCMRCLDVNDPLECLATIEYHKKPVTRLDCSPDHLASCSESGEVVLHKHASSPNQSAGFHSILARSSLASRCVRFSRDYKKVAVCSDELIIKIIDVAQPLKCQLLTGHTRSTKSLAWSPTSDLLISSSCDGTLRIWKTSTIENDDEPECIQTIANIIPSITPEELTTIEAVWHPSGDYFIVPTRDEGLAVFEANPQGQSWEQRRVVKRHPTSSNKLPSTLQDHKASLTSMAFSPNGIYLATGFMDGLLIIWDVRQWQYVCHVKEDQVESVTSICWKPNGNALVFGEHQGQIVTWNEVIFSHRDHPSNPLKHANSSTNRSFPPGRDHGLSSNLMEPEEFDIHSDELDDDAWAIDEAPRAGVQSTSDHISRVSRYSKSSASHRKPMGDASRQAPFQCGATRIRLQSGSSGSQRRYMAFNSIGLVHALEKDMENSVTVDFHDQGKRPRYHFTDRSLFSLCSMSELGVAFASRSNKSGTGESLIRYDPYESWATEGMSFAQLGEITASNGGSWQYSLPQGESVTCLACGGATQEHEDFGSDGITGSGSVIVGTDKGYVRFFKGSGIQSYLWNLGQQIISLACSNEWVFVVHRSLLDSSSSLHYTMMDTDTFEIIQEGLMPLSNEQTILTWIGFTAQHSIPACFTSAGVLSFLDKARRPKQGRWVPVLDTNDLPKSDGHLQRVYWPIGVSESQISCIILKGGETQPGFPTPIVQEIDLQMPLVRMDESQGQLEESHLRGSLLYNHHSDLTSTDDYSTKVNLDFQKVELDKQLLKLMQSSCNHTPAPQLQRALDYANLLMNMNSLEAASKMSKYFNLIGLEDRITKVKESKELQASTDPNKRISKYAHLEDYNIITGSKPSVNGRNTGRNRELFDKPFESTVAKGRSNGGGSLFSKGKVFKDPMPEKIQNQDEEMEYQDEVDNGDAHDEWAHEQTADDLTNVEFEAFDESRAQQPPRLSEYHLTNQAPAPRSVSTNPFAKKARHTSALNPNSPPTTNPFSSKTTTSKQSTLKKPGAFFNHVDERGAIAGSAAKGKTRQSTLFGLPSKTTETVPEGQKKAKKRKNESDQDNSKEVESLPAKTSRPLSSFLSKKSIKSVPETSNTSEIPQIDVAMPDASVIEKDQGSVAQELAPETQINESPVVEEESQASLMSIEYSQSLPPRIRSTHPEPDKEDDNETEQKD